MANIGLWLSAIGGILITYVSAKISYIHFFTLISVDFTSDVPPWYPSFMNDMVNSIGYYGLLLGILATAGAIFSILKGHAFVGGLVSLIFSGLSAIVGVLLWFPPFYVARAILVGGVEAYEPLFFSGVILGVAGGGVTIATSIIPRLYHLIGQSHKTHR